MDPQVFAEMQNLKTKLEAVRDKTVNEAEGHDFLVESVARIETILAIYAAPTDGGKQSMFGKILNP